MRSERRKALKCDMCNLPLAGIAKRGTTCVEFGVDKEWKAHRFGWIKG